MLFRTQCRPLTCVFCMSIQNSQALSLNNRVVEANENIRGFSFTSEKVMGNETVEETKLELLPCSFEFHDFDAQVGEVRISCRIMKMKDSLYVWIGDANDGKMSDLTLAMTSKYQTLPVATRIMGSNDDTFSASLAKRLAKKCGKPVYVSFNIAVTNLTLPGVEKAIQAEFNKHKELFIF